MKNNNSFFKITFIVIFVVLLFFIVSLNLITSPSSKNQQMVSINLMYSPLDPTFSQTLNTIIKTFESENPTIKIYSNSLKEKDFSYTEQINLYLTNSWPDLIELKDFHTAKELDSIAPFPQDLLTMLPDNVLQEDLNGNIWLSKTQVYNESKFYRVYYNKQLFSQLGLDVPNSYDELLAICQILASRNITPLGISGADNRGIQTLFTMLLGEFIHQNPTFFQNLSLEETGFGREYLILFEKIKILIDNYASKDWQTITEASALDDFQRRKTAMLIVNNYIEPIVDDSLYFQLDYFLMPSYANEQYYIIDNAFSNGWALSKNALQNNEKKEAIYTFLTFFYSGFTQEIFHSNHAFGSTFETQVTYNNKQLDERSERLSTIESDKKIITYSLPFNDVPFLHRFLTLQNQILYNYINGEIQLDELENELSITWNNLQKEQASYEK